MKTAICTLLLFFNLELVQAQEQVRPPSFQFSRGTTTVTVSGHKVRVTAEQRRQDFLVQVIAFPQQTGIRFYIQSLTFGAGAAEFPLSGPVAKVSGTISVWVSSGSPIQVPVVIPVQIRPVHRFTVPTDRARMQGNPCIEQQLRRML